MAKEVKSYAANQVKIIVGPHLITGVAPDTFVNIEPVTEGTVSEAGAYGDVARAMSLDDRHTITITLQQTSASNAALTGLHRLDQVTQGNGVVPVMVTDLRGGTLFSGQGWIKKMPAAGFASGLSNREWTLEGVGEFAIGGN